MRRRELVAVQLQWHCFLFQSHSHTPMPPEFTLPLMPHIIMIELAHLESASSASFFSVNLAHQWHRVRMHLEKRGRNYSLLLSIVESGNDQRTLMPCSHLLNFTLSLFSLLFSRLGFFLSRSFFPCWMCIKSIAAVSTSSK